jgi:signal transduction histidine kinase
MTSHDLKNPLQAAMANLELLADDLVENTNTDVHKSLDVIHKQLTRMNRIINGILDLERLKTGSSRMDLCSASETIKQAIEELHELAQDQQVALTTSVEDNIANFWADPDQFERALINLIENAIKFTPQHGKVFVRAKQRQNSVIFEIEDTGIGIPENLQSLVFERFLRGGERGQKGAEHISGSGLGLSLVKTIVESHQGKIWLSSQVGVGTTFYVQLPAATDPSIR